MTSFVTNGVEFPGSVNRDQLTWWDARVMKKLISASGRSRSFQMTEWH